MHFWKYHNADIHGTFKTPTQMKATSNRGELQHQHGEQLEFTFLEGRPDATWPSVDTSLVSSNARIPVLV